MILHFVFSWFLSCTQSNQIPEISQHKNIILDGNWSFQAWRSQRKLPKIDTRFSPDQNTKDLEQGTLVLKNIWWEGYFEQGQRKEEFDVGLFESTIRSNTSVFMSVFLSIYI